MKRSEKIYKEVTGRTNPPKLAESLIKQGAWNAWNYSHPLFVPSDRMETFERWWNSEVCCQTNKFNLLKNDTAQDIINGMNKL